jgi:hypothetical protein
MKSNDSIEKRTQTKFGGLNRTKGAADGDIVSMRNMTSDHFPLIASRKQRRLHFKLTNPGGLSSWEKLCWVDGDGFYYDGTRKGTVTAGHKTFTALGDFIVILPDKAYYNTHTGEFGPMESEWTGNSLTFTNGMLYEKNAEANTLQANGIRWSDYFREGDAVTISGASRQTDNNKTAIIREISEDKLYFYEYVFRLGGSGGNTPVTETGNLSVKRSVPDLQHICQNENRLWGCHNKTIYACKLGDIFNWNVFDGLDTDSYAVDVGSAGLFTACTSFLGLPIFFKEDHIYKVYGSLPRNYEVMSSATTGVMNGCAGSLAVAGEMLFYLSCAGIMAYTGGIPQPVGTQLGTDRHSHAVGGSDGQKYYAAMRGSGGDEWNLYVYDVQKSVWHTEDNVRVIDFANYNGNLYFLNHDGEIWIAGNMINNPEGDDEEPVVWLAEFADFTAGTPGKKGVSKVYIRMELDAGATAAVSMQFDSGSEWVTVGETKAENRKRSYILPIVPRRTDHFRLRIEGVGGVRIHSVTREFYRGSEN